MCSDTRVAMPEAQQAQQQTRRCDKIKCPAPTKVSADQSTDYIAERAADWNRRAKNRHDPTTRFDREEIGQNGRCGRPVAAFTNSYANSSREENAECHRETGAAAGQTPQNHSGADDDPARESIGEQTENRRADHVSYKERISEQTGLGHRVYVAGCEETCANIRLECG